MCTQHTGLMSFIRYLVVISSRPACCNIESVVVYLNGLLQLVPSSLALTSYPLKGSRFQLAVHLDSVITNPNPCCLVDNMWIKSLWLSLPHQYAWIRTVSKSSPPPNPGLFKLVVNTPRLFAEEDDVFVCSTTG